MQASQVIGYDRKTEGKERKSADASKQFPSCSLNQSGAQMGVIEKRMKNIRLITTLC